MKTVKTAKGQFVDMAAMISANEEMRAVGNVPMRANGDRLDKSGNVIATVQHIARAQHENDTVTKTVNISEIPNTISDSVKQQIVANELLIINEVEKVRDDGTKYKEIEYDDGSMEIEEILKVSVVDHTSNKKKGNKK